MVNLGLIGLGTWGKNVLRNFENLPDCKVLVACDSNPDQIKKVQPNYPGIDFTHKMEEVLEHQKIDAVVIVTPPASHFELAKRALLNDKDVFVEKPMVLEVEKAKEILELSEKRKKILMVGHIMEYHSATLKLKEIIEKGELGKIYYLYASRVNLGRVRDTENALWSFAPHDISMILYLLDKEPLSVTATGECYIQKKKDIEDVVFMTMHFADGVMAHIHVSWLDPHKERRLTIVGDKKMAVLDDMESSEKIRIYDKGVQSKLDYSSYGEFLTLRSGEVLIPKLDNYEPLKAECQHFLECVTECKTPRSDGRDGLRVLKILAAGQESLKKGGTIVKVEI